MSNIKEPYSISVWEEERIEAENWYVSNERIITKEEYEKLSEDKQEKYEFYSDGYYIKPEERLTKDEYELVPPDKREAEYDIHTVMEHYEETRGIIIGAHDMDSVYGAINPVLKKNVNGSVELTFSLYYKVFDPEVLDFCINPFTQLLVNEAKVKVHFRNKWYDLVVKNCVEDSVNSIFTYTCKDIYVNELNKNGFKVELDVELENNQGTITDLAETILLDTDWEIDRENSQPIIETKIEPLYLGTLNQDVTVIKVNDYIPDEYADMTGQWEFEDEENKQPVSQIVIAKGSKVLFFYSDITENVKQPQFLARLTKEGSDEKYNTIDPDTETGMKQYQTDANEDIIINAYNYQITSPAVYYIDSDTEYNIPSVTEESLIVYDYARGEKVIKSQLSGYDPDLDQFIFKFYKKDDMENPIEYYGYTKTEHLTSSLAQNYLANSDNFTSLDSGWYFDGIPAKTVKIRGKEKTAAYSGQIFQLTDPTQIGKDLKTEQESVLVLQLRNEEDSEDRVYYPDSQGEFYKIYQSDDSIEYVEISSPKAKAYEDSVRACVYDQRDYYIEGYADKTDDELNDIINEVLYSSRYSYRSRHAINNGVAANRKVIENLTPGEQYLFAASLGKFTEGEGPEYKRSIQYGGKVPNKFYTFSDSNKHSDFIRKAVKDTLGDKEEWDDKYKQHKYYYYNPTYASIYNEVYNSEIKDAEQEYEKRFLFWLNTANKEAKDQWRRGGFRYRNEVFLEFLRKNSEIEGKVTIEEKGENGEIISTRKVKFCDYVAEEIIEKSNIFNSDSENSISCTKQLYNIFIQTVDQTTNPPTFYGVYPDMVKETVNEANRRAKEPFRIDAYWEPMAYNNTMFSNFDIEQQDIASMALSFNESLFAAFYQGLKQVYIKTSSDGKSYVWNQSNIKDKESLAIDIEEILKAIYKAAYEEENFLKVYDKAKQYKMPNSFNPDGGDIYQAYKARWEAAAEKTALNQAQTRTDNINNLYSMPDCLRLIAEDNSEEPDETLETYYTLLSNLATYIQEKIVTFKQDYSIEQIEKGAYNEKLLSKYPIWVGEFLGNDTYGQYYYASFLPEFLNSWVSEQEISAYVFAEDKYELNNSNKLGDYGIGDENTPTLTAGQSLIPHLNAENRITNPIAKEFVNGLYTTSSTGAEYVAVKTNYNPYTNKDVDSAGGYVFDRNDEIIRLFDPERDAISATYKPIKSDSGDYIYDVFEQVYRPFRDWSVTEKRNPVTFEEDDTVGVHGDVTYHPIKAFDGHMGAWQETPTRYNMVRVRENPMDPEKYTYLPKKISYQEKGHYNGEVYPYEIPYPAGYQTDNYEQDSKGQYILSSSVRKPRRTDLFIKIFGEDAYWHLFGGTNNEEDKGSYYQIVDKTSKNLWKKIQSWFNSVYEFFFEGKTEREDLSIVYSDSESGLFVSNGDKSDSEEKNNQGQNYYDEDIESARIYTLNDNFIFVPMISDIANQAESNNAIEKGLVSKLEDAEVQQTDTVMIKYKPWYWRHWGSVRYSYKPKICVQKVVNGLTVFKPFNSVEDVISDDYRVININEYDSSKDGIVAFYLKNRKTQYRIAKDLDYGTRKYRMELQDKKKKEYWVESPNGEDYLRHYKLGDGETKLWDGHFGRWVDCFKAVERPVEDSLNDWSESNEHPGLVSKDGVKALPEYYLPYGDIMIPWDARVFNRDKRFTRQPEVYREANRDNLYVLSDDIYMTLDDYYDNNGFEGTLDYTGLTASFVADFKYDSASFNIELPENRKEYLSFDLSNEPDGTIDLVVSKSNDVETKERWIYWIGTVSKQFSLTENPLQTIGMLFETSRTPDENGKVAPYPFLGMQMFKYIPYEKKQQKIDIRQLNLNEETIVTGESTEEENHEHTNIQSAVIDIYNQLFGGYEGSQTLMYSNSYDYIKGVLSLNKRYAAMVSRLFSDYGYVWDIEEPDTIEVVNSEPIKIPLFPGEAPDAKDLFRTLYYIYDPEKVTDVDDVVYEYVGTEPLYDEASNPNGMFRIAYDEQCQKVRSIKGKESNYFKLLQDCCDTFDCWLEPIIEHDETGRVKYIEKTVYIESKLTTDDEPQMYIGEDAKRRALDDKIAWYLKRFGYGTENSRIKIVVDENNNPVSPVQYEKNTNVELEEEEQLELRELNRLSHIIENLTLRYIMIPDKKIRFRRYVGKENWNGFKYGVNLKHIKRTIDSTQISTRVIVKPNSNEHAKDNFCTIQRAQDNPIKENFLYDFSYYTQQGLLDKKELNNDLYTNLNTRLNYYNELNRINKENDKVIEELSSCLVDLDTATANYETAVLKRDAATEEISKLALTFTSNYDTYGQILDIPWTPNKSQEYITKKQTVAPETKFETTAKTSTNEEINVTIDIPKTATSVDYPKYNDSLRTLLDQMDTYQEEYAQSIADIEKYEPEKKRLEARIVELQEKQRIIADKKNELNKLFYHKYSRFIQEGTWVDENYIDDNLYYLDALSVLRTSCKPKITYDIGIIDISAAIEFEEDKILLETELGDRTYVEDVEFFGYRSDGQTPYQEMVVVSEKTYNLDDPSQNQTKVKNYSTQFDDLFQRIAATSQTLQFNEGSYSRAASIIDNNGTINSELLQKSIEDGNVIVWNSQNEKIQTDNTGITIQNSENANIIKLVSHGIVLSTDGGNTWKTAITGNGINADLLTAGRIDTNMLLIGNSDKPNFFWNSLGLSAFRIEEDKIDYSTFVRLDQYGIYGIRNLDVKDRTVLSLNDTFAPRSIKEVTDNSNAVFGLTWNGFFLNASNGTGRVVIGTEQDFKMSEFSSEERKWKDKVVIGRLHDKNGLEYYGFRLQNNNNEIVMETNESGELYLKRKLRISNFGDIQSYDTLEYVNEQLEYNGEVYEDYFRKYTTYNKKQCIEYYTDSINQNETGKTLIYREFIINSFQASDDFEYIKGQLTYDGITYEEYFRKYTTYENKDCIEYYIVNAEAIDEKIFLYRDFVTTENWKELTSDPQDRVTLGIVDVYDRDNDYNQVITPQGTYNSSNYLTKVFSIKANANVGLEQFSQKTIDNLIEKNENFAIFDNGNLFAKNAWIEGNINATSGTFTNGTLGDLQVFGTLEIGQQINDKNEIISSGILKHIDGNWEINGDGSAFFKNVTVSGKIETAIFEHNKVQTVAGSLLVVSEIPIKEDGISIEDNVVTIYLEAAPPTNKLNTTTRIPSQTTRTINPKTTNNTDTRIAKVTLLNNFLVSSADATGLKKYNVLGYGEEKKNGTMVPYIKIDKASSTEDFSLKKYVLFLGFPDQNDNNDEVLGIVINTSSGSDLYPKDAISIVDINKPKQKPKTLLGLFDQDLFSVSNNTLFTKNMIGKYGLYSDNAYVKGTMISETSKTVSEKGVLKTFNYITGLTTTEDLPVSVNGTTEYAVLFAGTNLKIDSDTKIANGLTFYVTREGHLHAEGGYFNGTIETSTIIGNGTTDYALKIVGNNTKNALRFAKTESNDTIEYLSLTTEGCYFYNNLDKDSDQPKEQLKNTQLFSVLYTDENLGVGMFSKGNDKNQLSDYGLNFTKEVKKIQTENGETEYGETIINVNYYGNIVATIDENGFKSKSENGLGDYCECQTVKRPKSDIIIGVDFVLQNI